MKSESNALADVIQLTDGFDRAGEAYFSHDMKWIIFQAFPNGEDQYQMYVAAAAVRHGRSIAAAGRGTLRDAAAEPEDPGAERYCAAWRTGAITPPKSRNTCGYFSPDGNSIIFASTAGKDNPDEPRSGYQRQGGDYAGHFLPAWKSSAPMDGGR